MTMEEKLDALQRQVDQLQALLTRRTDREEIANLMGRYQYLFAAYRCTDILNELWSRDPDIHLEDGPSGVYLYDRNGVGDYYRQRFGEGSDPNPGEMRMDTLTTPVIEVAADGRTAKGVWISTGHESAAFPDGTESGIPTVDSAAPDAYGNRVFAHWVWKKYAVDFIREANGWKIWHLHIYDVFRCPFDENWVTYSIRRDEDDAALDSRIRLDHGGITPENPTTFHWQYRTDTVPVLEPKPPVPYTTFAETFGY